MNDLADEPKPVVARPMPLSTAAATGALLVALMLALASQNAGLADALPGMAIITGAMALLVVRTRVRADAAGLVKYGLLRSTTIRWSEVEDLALLHPAARPSLRVVAGSKRFTWDDTWSSADELRRAVERYVPAPLAFAPLGANERCLPRTFCSDGRSRLAHGLATAGALLVMGSMISATVRATMGFDDLSPSLWAQWVFIALCACAVPMLFVWLTVTRLIEQVELANTRTVATADALIRTDGSHELAIPWGLVDSIRWVEHGASRAGSLEVAHGADVIAISLATPDVHELTAILAQRVPREVLPTALLAASGR